MIKILEAFGGNICKDGIFSFVSGVTSGLKSDDFLFDLYTPFSCDEDIKKSKGEIGVNSVFSANMKNNNLSKLLSVSYYCKLLKKEKYDVVHIHGSTQIELVALSLGAKACRVKKIIVHSHNSGLRKSIKHSLIKWLTTPIINYCSTDFFACSQKAAEWKFSKKVAQKKAKIIKNGIDISKYKIDESTRKTYRKKIGYSENDLIIGHVGRFNFQKNHKFLIDLLYELKKESNRYKLLLVGDGELKEEIEEYAKAKGVFDDIVFTGVVNNVQDFLQAMDLFALPSLFEGLPFVSIEAQACGLPNVLSSEISNEVKLSENVEFVSIEDINKWIEVIKRMIKLPKTDNTEQIRMNGYDICDTAKIIKEIYNK